MLLSACACGLSATAAKNAAAAHHHQFLSTPNKCHYHHHHMSRLLDARQPTFLAVPVLVAYTCLLKLTLMGMA